MRIDKFLKMARLVKRRTVAAEMAEAGVVRINGRTVKPASGVREGDEIEVAFPRRVITARVLCADETAIKRGAAAAEIAGERAADPEERPW